MTRPRILLTRRMPDAVEARLAQRYELTTNSHERPMTPHELKGAMGGHDAICPNPTDRLDAAMFKDPGQVRLVANYGAGFEHIDIEAAARAGVAVTNTPGAVTEPTADLAMMLILVATRRAGEGERELRAGRWTGWRPGHLVGQSLSGKLLGLVGFGRIAQATAARARAFGLRIAYFSRSRVAPEIERALEATHYASLDDLVSGADIISLHCPGGEQTRHLINAARLARMKPSSVLINTARGSVVDEAALAEALARRRIAAAGLDVYEGEPNVHPALLTLQNVVLLPHMGSATVEARTRMGMQVADNLDAFFDGRQLPDRVA